jgi:hypothetical protein
VTPAPILLSNKSVIAMLVGYFDMSYSHPPRPLVYTIAGYISEDKKWSEFNKQWQQALDKENITVFQIREFVRRTGIYKNWPDTKRTRYLRRLHGIIHRHAIADFAVSVVTADYDKVMPPDLKASIGDPHAFAAFNCLRLIKSWAKRTDITEPVHFVFNEGAMRGASIRTVFGGLDETQERGQPIGGVSFYGKKMLPLQAADVAAYENMREMRRRADTDNTDNQRGAYKSLIRPESIWVYLDAAQLLKLLGGRHGHINP